MDHFFRNGFFLTKDLIKRNIGKYFFPLLSHNQLFWNTGDLTGLFITYKNIPCFIYTDQPLGQTFRQNVHLAFLPAAFGIHQVKTVVIGCHHFCIIHETFCFRQVFPAHTQGNLHHHSIRTGPVIAVDHCFYRIWYKTWFSRRYCNIDLLF